MMTANTSVTALKKPQRNPIRAFFPQFRAHVTGGNDACAIGLLRQAAVRLSRVGSRSAAGTTF
jgi:hypothetical protein